MSKARWLFFLLLAVCVALPSYAVELTLGGFPSYLRTRYRFIKDATFINSLSDDLARDLGFSDFYAYQGPVYKKCNFYKRNR